MIDLCYERACQLLTENRDKLTAVAESLLDRDTLNRKEFEMVMNGEELPPKTEAEQVTPTEEEPAEQAEAGEETKPFEPITSDTLTEEEDDSPFIEPEDENE